MKKKQIIVYLSALLIATLLVAGSLFATGRLTFTRQKEVGDDIKPKARISTEGWKTCRNEAYGYEFKHPAEWSALSFYENGAWEHEQCIGKNTTIGEKDPMARSPFAIHGDSMRIEIQTKEDIEKHINTSLSGRGNSANPLGTFQGLSKEAVEKIEQSFIRSPNKTHGMYFTELGWWNKDGIVKDDGALITDGKRYISIYFLGRSGQNEYKPFPPDLEETILSTFKFVATTTLTLDYSKLTGKNSFYSEQEGKYQNLKEEEKKLMRLLLMTPDCIADPESVICSENKNLVENSSIVFLTKSNVLIKSVTNTELSPYRFYNIRDRELISSPHFIGDTRSAYDLILLLADSTSLYTPGMSSFTKVKGSDLSNNETYRKSQDPDSAIEITIDTEGRIHASVFDSKSEPDSNGIYKKIRENFLVL